MKTLLIIRHAKAIETFGNDKQRTLSEKGKEDAAAMAKFIKQQGYMINKIFTSPADRTLQTTLYFAQEHSLQEKDIVIFEKLYLGDTLAITETVNWLQENISTLAVVGHNPGVSNFVNDITDAGIDALPTCGVAIIEAACDDWQDFNTTTKKLVTIITPKNI